VRRPQPAALDLLLQRCEHAVEAVAAQLLEDRLQRPDLVPDELPDPVELLLKLGLRREVPRHRPISFRAGPTG